MPRFQKVYLEITHACNLRSPAFLTRERFLRALDQLAPYTRYLYFHIKGEPLLHPLLPDFLTLAGERGFQVNLTTNGVLLPNLSPALLEAPALRQVNLSLHSYQPQAHGEMEGYLSAAASYARKAAERGKHTVFRLWTLDPSRETNGTCRRLLDLLSREFPSAGDLSARSGERSLTLEPHIFLSFEEEFAWPSLSAPAIPGPGTCYGARRMLGILCDGTVVPCCLDGEGECPLGNLFTEDLRDILARPPLEEMAQGFRNRKITQDLCRRCGYRTRFA